MFNLRRNRNKKWGRAKVLPIIFICSIYILSIVGYLLVVSIYSLFLVISMLVLVIRNIVCKKLTKKNDKVK